ncbi:MAG: uracil-DNA glycosylase family protein [Anaerolineae bacterium]
MLQANLAACRRCADAGYFIGSTPIATLNAGATFMTVGQAPGRHEAEVTGLPFSGPAGKRLFRWLAQAGFAEAEFRATQAMMAVTLCYPGPHPAGRGDRVPTRDEQALCAPWLEAALALIRPRVLIPVGALAIARFLSNQVNPVSGIEASAGLSGEEKHRIGIEASAGLSVQREKLAKASTPEIADGKPRKPIMTDLIGGRFECDGRIIVPLPHPSGASQWFNAAENKVRLEKSLAILAELRTEFLSI